MIPVLIGNITFSYSLLYTCSSSHTKSQGIPECAVPFYTSFPLLTCYFLYLEYPFLVDQLMSVHSSELSSYITSGKLSLTTSPHPLDDSLVSSIFLVFTTWYVIVDGQGQESYLLYIYIYFTLIPRAQCSKILT